MPRGVPQGRLLAPFLLLAVTAAMASSEEGEGPVVRVAQGSLRGRRIQRPEGSALRTVYAFEGVPYARPPLGDRRFKDPEEADAWTGVLNATAFGSRCIQKNSATGNVSGSEDCLFLNIYTADPPSAWSARKQPVVVFMHGGSFTQSSGDMRVRTPDPFLRRGLLFLSFNYRLGVMGFLNTEDGEVPGNAAMKDQVMVLRWVQRNIGAFGGDNSNVTIMGESAGAMAVHYHLLSPLSKGLFHRAICVSGSVLSRKALQSNPRATALALRRRWAQTLCPSEEEESIAACLRRIPATDLVFNQYDVPLLQFQNYFGKSTFRPSIEAPGSSAAPFLSTNPLLLLQRGDFRKVPFMTGFTSGEGLLYLGFGRLLRNASARWAQVQENFPEVFRWEVPVGVARTGEVAEEVRNFYLGNASLYDATARPDILEKFVRMVTDIIWAAPAARSSRIMSARGAPVFLYEFSHEGLLTPLKSEMRVEEMPGVAHGDDMVYVFDYWKDDGRPQEFSPEEQSIRERQADLFANMAATGNPTPPGSGLMPQWPPLTPQRESYVRMDAELSVGNNALGDRMAFWSGLMERSTEETASVSTRAE